MGNSLQEQLLKAGLVDEQQVKAAKKAKHKQRKQRPGGETEAVEKNRLLARKALAEKAQRDRELNRQQKEKAERRAIRAQIRQLMEVNRQPRDDGELAYNFQDGNKIKRLFVSEDLRKQLSCGLMAVVKLNGRYEVVPVAVAEKIGTLDERCVIVCNAGQHSDDKEDPYSDYKVPDDLTW